MFQWVRHIPWLMEGEHPAFAKRGKQLRSYSRRGQEVEQLVLHESVTRTGDAAVKVLERRKLGVHYVVDRDGSLSYHAPATKACSHAGSGHNRKSIGLEVINRYYGDKAVEGEEVIEAVWAHKGKYILPTEAQMSALWMLFAWLVARWDVPIEFPGGGDYFSWGRLSDHNKPGVMAHHRWAHADGLFPEHYLLCRSLGADHANAWSATVRAASSGKRRTEDHWDVSKQWIDYGDSA
jgi:hypothetical protein